MSSVFEIAARVLRRHWAVLLAVSVLVGLPSALLGTAASIPIGEALVDILPEAGSTAPVTITDAQVRTLGDALLVATAGWLIAGMLAGIAAVGFAWVVQRDYHGQPVTFGDTLSRSIGRALTALGASLLAALATAGLLVLGALGALVCLSALGPVGAAGGGLGPFLAILVGVVAFLAVTVLGVRWALAIPIVAIEPVGPLAALRRSWHLTGGAAWRTFFALLLTLLVTGILGALITQLLAIVIVDMIAEPAGMPLVGEVVVSTFSTVLFAPVSTVILTVYLFDQMVRRDGWDLPVAG